MVKGIHSYASYRGLHQLRLVWHLLQYAGFRALREYARETVESTRAAEEMVFRVTGRRIENVKALEIGPGQLPRQSAYFSCKNEVIGIDLDVIAQSFDVKGYWRMWRQNGSIRVAKTLGRKALGYDRAFRRGLKEELALKKLPKTPILHMDASQINFPNASFDFVYSFDVFYSIPEPQRALKEVARVLKPGGCAYISLRLFTSENGSMDIRVTSGNRSNIPYWSHLRPQYQQLIVPSSYANGLSSADWTRLLD